MQIVCVLSVGVPKPELGLTLIDRLMRLGPDYRVANPIGCLVGFVVVFELNSSWVLARILLSLLGECRSAFTPAGAAPEYAE